MRVESGAECVGGGWGSEGVERGEWACREEKVVVYTIGALVYRVSIG